jgi:hypothetical protein
MPNVTTQLSSTLNPQQNGPAKYSPPNWTVGKALYAIIVNDTASSTPVTQDENGNFVMQTNVAGSQATMFVFDGLRQADHEQACIPTQHPLQTGYNISDHAVLQPARITIEVFMSDAIAAYSTGMWSGNPSKSVAAWQQLITLMQNRALITLNTRYQTYTNMLLVNVRGTDNQKNYFGGSFTLTFQQLIISTVSQTYNSARSQTTGTTGLGTVQTQQPAANLLSQFTESSTNNLINGNGTSVITPPGAGPISSNLLTGGI